MYWPFAAIIMLLGTLQVHAKISPINICLQAYPKKIPEELSNKIIAVDRFHRVFTFQGYVFAGKPEWAVARDLAGDFHFAYRSDDGHGVFTTSFVSLALEYASPHLKANVTPFRVRTENPLLIVASSIIKSLPEAFELREGKHIELEKHVAWKRVAEIYGIDIIYDESEGWVVLQNSQAFEAPQTWREMAEIQRKLAFNVPPTRTLEQFVYGLYARSYAKLVEKERIGLPAPSSLLRAVSEKVSRPASK